MTTTEPRTYTHPDVLTIGVRDGWADPRTAPEEIHWPLRQQAAAIPFTVVDGRPVNPCEQTGIRYGRGELGHWGEAQAADAMVIATDMVGDRWLLMVERTDGHGWALPGGHVDPGESAVEAARRELREETGLEVPADAWSQVGGARYVPDPRATDEAWMVTTLVRADLPGRYPADQLPQVTGLDDAARAAWVRADCYDALAAYLRRWFGGVVFRAHCDMLRDALDS